MSCKNWITCFIAICAIVQSINGQKIIGKIIDDKGEAVPYASVYIKNSTKGATANSEGKYLLAVSSGNYVIVCQHINFAKQEKRVEVGENIIEIDFIMTRQEIELGSVIVKSGEDYAYTVIRETIKKRKNHLAEYDKFKCQVYTKGQMRLRDFPKKFFGKKVDFEDGDTSKKKVLFLSETVSKYSSVKPDKIKIEVVSSQVSGSSNGYGLSVPTIFSMYDNLMQFGEQLNPRGFISPIADNALQFYKYKYLGSFIEDGREICKIQVTPKRKYEPLGTGIISIVEEEWRIHSVDFVFTKASQLQLLDTLQLQQLYRPVANNKWAIASQIIYPAATLFGFDMYGSFVNVYSDFNMEPLFPKGYFNNVVLKYEEDANKKDSSYWEHSRPVPLQQDEIADYKRKDSLETLRKNPHYLDSVDRVKNKLKPLSALLTGYVYQKRKTRELLSIGSVLAAANFNPVEGLVLALPISWNQRIDSSIISRKNITIAANLRYGFLNKHFNPSLSATYNFGKKRAYTIGLSGGKDVFQFNNYSTIDPKNNTWTSLFSKNNQLKIYEAVFAKFYYYREIVAGLSGTASFEYQDRLPLENGTKYSFDKSKKDTPYAPNYPEELMSENLLRHQTAIATLSLYWQPGIRYIELPERKINMGSNYPTFNLQYHQALKRFLGSDADFAKWKFTINDDINLKLQGQFSYRVGIGGFLYTNKVAVPDYTHFNGNRSGLAAETLSSFQLLPVYRFSNTTNFYSLIHIEHNLKGFLTNKIPGVKKLNLYLVWGANGFYINNQTNYVEVFAGIDNIFKMLRIDFVQGFINGKLYTNGFRFGLSRSSIFARRN